jgi:hypothetical protein
MNVTAVLTIAGTQTATIAVNVRLTTISAILVPPNVWRLAT